MKKSFYAKITTAAIALLVFPYMVNADKVRGSIITSDNKIVAQSIDKEQRVYPFKSSLTPLLEYIDIDSKLKEKMRLEGYEQVALAGTLDVKLTINLELQQQIESLLDEKKASYDADEIIAAVMESSTGKILAMGSSNRYSPSQDEIPLLSPKFASYMYESGSVIKPLTLAIALNHSVVEPSTVFNTYNGRLELGNNRSITDDAKFKSLNATDIIVHSSNIGISQISWLVTGKEFRDGLFNFGLGSFSGIELFRDAQGSIKSLELLDHKMHRANSAYGYGMGVTFTQLLKAYSAFNNDGIAVTPKLIESLQDQKGNVYHTLQKKMGDIAISPKSAKQVHKILIEVVKRGAGVKAQYPGLEIGGMTGTAHISKNGKYVSEYHSSFYGFANDDEGHKYTIGVLVIRAKEKPKYFASLSAVPVFKEITKLLVESEYLNVGGEKN